MSTSIITGYPIDQAVLPQGSNSLPEKAVTQLYRATSYVVSSINQIAQSILSKCIYMGSLGRYTLDDIKNYLFTDQAAVRDEALPSNKEEVFESTKSKLERSPSMESGISISPSIFGRAVVASQTNSAYAECNGKLIEMAKLSSCVNYLKVLEEEQKAASVLKNNSSSKTLEAIDEE